MPFSSIYFWNWIQVRVAYENGYQLVDGYSNIVVANYHTLSCQSGYDSCALRRDQLNYQTGRSQYFCSECFDYDRNYNYNWDYDRDFYITLDDGYSNY